MAIEIISGEQAWETLERSKTAHWPSRQMPDRLYPIATPLVQTSFQIQPDEKVFCIGSCFAREIGEALQRLNFNVLSIFQELRQSPLRKRSDDNLYNKYSVASIYNELYWAFHPDSYDHDKVFIETGDKRLQDYQLTGSNYADEPHVAQQFRLEYNKAFQSVKEADVLVLTLGLSEVWFDTHTNLYLNRAVSRAMLNLYPNRFQVHVFDYGQTAKTLEDIYALLQAHLKPDFRLLVTVSPIPLFATFRQQDILVANAYSKAVLRTVIDHFLVNKTNVNYFPSYEFITLSNPALIWNEDDFRHVNRAFIDYIMGNVMAQFMASPSAALAETNAIAKATALYQGNFFTEAIAVLAPFIKQKGTVRPELLLLWGAIRLRVHGKYKMLLIEGLTYLRSKISIGSWQLLRDAVLGFRKISTRDFIGYIEKWDGHVLTGWACCLGRDISIKVNVIVDDHVLMTVLADMPRADVAAIYGDKQLRCGFRLTLSRAELSSDTVRVAFADTGGDLRHSPLLLSAYDKSQLKGE